MISWSGNGVTSLTVLLFCSHMSNTVCSLPLFFGTHNIGTTWCAAVGTHHPAVVYRWIFSDSSSLKCSAHFGKQYFIRLLGSIKLITWLTSLKGGSSSGIPPTISSIFPSHAVLRRGMSSSVRTTRVSGFRCSCLVLRREVPTSSLRASISEARHSPSLWGALTGGPL